MTAHPLYRLIYMSTARDDMSDGDLEAILTVARRSNVAASITGLLLYGDRHFLQCLEGEQQHVETLYDRIAADPRHSGVLRLIAGPIDARAFPDWSMGFRRLDRNQASVVAGFVDLASQDVSDVLPPQVPQEVAVFMEHFSRHNILLSRDR
ncbi:BLUF domain-containing protein [Pelagibius sp.]|uniref:BLUF domain-containing protein n=1 Tax=Pelagibius sp. TaxID=1931238 RepID=UPI00260EEA57|nr:BLUF domain-containing protein [Pelagibius sp.]